MTTGRTDKVNAGFIFDSFMGNLIDGLVPIVCVNARRFWDVHLFRIETILPLIEDNAREAKEGKEPKDFLRRATNNYSGVD